MENIEFDLPQNDRHIIKVIGVGGGGSNAVNYMFEQGIRGVDFAICNTDRQALDQSDIPVKIQLGPELTGGKGAGNKPEVGRQACVESIEEIKSFLDSDTKMLFITAGMGGGTGTGAAPVIAKTAQEMGILTVAIVTKPFGFEGFNRKKHGDSGIAELRSNVDTLVVISNDQLSNIYPDLSLSQAFCQADNILNTAARGIAEIITVPGYINVDFEDVNTVMRDSGVAVMGMAFMEGEDRAAKVVSKALESPLLENNDIHGAQNILLHITSGKNEVSMEEMNTIMEHVQKAAGDADIIWGNSNDPSLENELHLTVVATGFGKKREENKTDQAAAGRAVPGEDNRVVIPLNDEEEKIFETESDPEQKTERIDFDLESNDKRIKFTNEEKDLEVEEERIVKRKKKQSAIDVSKLDGQTLREYENVPAYKRRQVFLQDQIKSSGELSGLSISGSNKDETKVKKNSYLHNNVD